MFVLEVLAFLLTLFGCVVCHPLRPDILLNRPQTGDIWTNETSKAMEVVNGTQLLNMLHNSGGCLISVIDPGANSNLNSPANCTQRDDVITSAAGNDSAEMQLSNTVSSAVSNAIIQATGKNSVKDDSGASSSKTIIQTTARKPPYFYVLKPMQSTGSNILKSTDSNILKSTDSNILKSTLPRKHKTLSNRSSLSQDTKKRRTSKRHRVVRTKLYRKNARKRQKLYRKNVRKREKLYRKNVRNFDFIRQRSKSTAPTMFNFIPQSSTAGSTGSTSKPVVSNFIAAQSSLVELTDSPAFNVAPQSSSMPSSAEMPVIHERWAVSDPVLDGVANFADTELAASNIDTDAVRAAESPFTDSSQSSVSNIIIGSNASSSIDDSQTSSNRMKDYYQLSKTDDNDNDNDTKIESVVSEDIPVNATSREETPRNNETMDREATPQNLTSNSKSPTNNDTSSGILPRINGTSVYVSDNITVVDNTTTTDAEIANNRTSVRVENMTALENVVDNCVGCYVDYKEKPHIRPEFTNRPYIPTQASVSPMIQPYVNTQLVNRTAVFSSQAAPVVSVGPPVGPPVAPVAFTSTQQATQAATFNSYTNMADAKGNGIPFGIIPQNTTVNIVTPNFVSASTVEASSAAQEAHGQDDIAGERQHQLRGDVETVSIGELKEMLKDGEVRLVDVREPWELRTVGEIEGAINIPLNTLGLALRLSDRKFKRKYGVEKPESDDCSLVFMGSSGIRSEIAFKYAKEHGFQCPKSVHGGFDLWKKQASPDWIIEKDNGEP